MLYFNIYFQIGVFIQPLINGEFPKSVMDSQKKTNCNENFKIPRLVEFSDAEKEDLIGNKNSLNINGDSKLNCLHEQKIRVWIFIK